MQTQWSLQDAKNKFSQVVNAAQAGTPQVVTKRGVPVVVVLSAESYDSMIQQERLGGSFASFLLSMPTCDDVEKQSSGFQLREVDW
ncbi:MAG: type II toxin-antitoxin system Phd/YefM family antitoxin [Desulfovibrio sp.]|jgi:prevent-host-death family protein|nr:type II toxin-antitoxin system Phd/YefM family antitoxin [Desulfovibrio sp.]